MHTFYVSRPQINDDTVTVVGQEHHHLRNVIRLKTGDNIRIIDGEGTVITATITKIGSDLTDVIIEELKYHKYSTPTINLFQGLPKHDKMDLILQKTTELGVSQFFPMITERTLQKPSNNRIERWERIILSATKQCGRPWLPNLNEIQILKDCINTAQSCDLSLVLSEKENKQHIQSLLRNKPEIRSIALLIGPEGGFTESEVNIATEMGIIPVTIGSNIMRTETAAIAGVAMVAYENKL